MFSKSQRKESTDSIEIRRALHHYKSAQNGELIIVMAAVLSMSTDGMSHEAE